MVFPGACLELNRTLSALRQEDDDPVLCKLGRGTVVTVAGITRDSGLVFARCMSQMYALFADDLEEAAERTDAPGEHLWRPRPVHLTAGR